MKNKKILFISLLILAIGFAAVSTTLYIIGNVAYQTNKDDFDVYFSGAELDGVDVSNIVIKDKKNIEFTSNELKSINDISSLMYEVTNESTQYDATVTISCTPMKTDYIEVTLDPVTFEVKRGQIAEGIINAKLISVSNTMQDVSIACELSVQAIEKDSVVEVNIDDSLYAISGYLLNSSGTSLSRQDLAIFSDKKLIQTDKNGYFYVDELERGIHHIYAIIDEEDFNKNEEELKGQEIAIISTNGYIEIKDKSYKIDNIKVGKELVDEGVYCELQNGDVIDIKYEGTNGTDGEIQSYTIPYGCTGTYKLEVWGAQGGSSVNRDTDGHKNLYDVREGGYGAYSVGEIILESNEKIFLAIGGQPPFMPYNYETIQKGGYNGGGSAYFYNSGGGATHIATIDGTLEKIGEDNDQDKVIMVAGGGAASSVHVAGSGHCIGGSGGGFKSQMGKNGSNNGTYFGTPATQTSGNKFGAGGSSSGYAAGAGGGWYGGYLSPNPTTSWDSCGTGGSGYIGYEKLNNAVMYCYGCEENNGTDNVKYKTINTLGNTVGVDKTNCPSGYSSNAISKCAKSGHGHARITLISLD